MSPRRSRTPILDQLSLAERGELLAELLAKHPELTDEAEQLAQVRLATVDADAVAEDVEWALRNADVDQLSSRAGRVYGRGYVHENEAAYELLEEELEPYLTDITRRAALGLTDAARVIGLGLLRGLANCESHAEDGSLLDYAGPDVPSELALSVSTTLAESGVSLSDNDLEGLPAGWTRPHEVAQ